MNQLHKNSLPNSQPYPFPQLDRQQAGRQLKYLHYQLGGDINLRFFYHSDDPRKLSDKGRKLNQLHYKEIEAYQCSGRGVYVVVNGAGGGHEDKDIQQCIAIFCEWDDRPVEDQLLHWETVGFLEPTFTVFSGDKSAQPYWVFDQPITVERWRELQYLLIKVMGADPSNKNPSRVFRLAGGWHVKPGREPVRTEIIQDSGKKYSYEQVRQELLNLHQKQQPVNTVEQTVLLPLSQLNQNNSVSATPGYKHYEDIQVPVPQSVHLEICLSKESRSLLQYGVSEGGRNSNGAKLARDLIGAANYLQSIGQRFDGDPCQLLEDYANLCSPPLPTKEVEAIWKSAQKDNPTPSCRAEGVEACVRAWYWKHHIKPDQSEQATWKRSNHSSGLGFGNNSGDSSNQPPIAAVSLCDRIREILNRCETESALANALMDLATATGRTYNEINSLAKIVRSEGELAAEVMAAVKSFQGIVKSCRKRLDIRRYLENILAEPLLGLAAAMPTAPEYLFNTLLSTSASRIGSAARAIINPEGGYTQPCIFWTANVAHSGQAKTPPQQAILEPLLEMETAAKEMHEVQLKDYEQDKDADDKPPVRQRRLLNNVTTSTKIRIHDENQRGLLEYIDELVADFQRLNQYKSGKGDDLQQELSFWNGGSANFDRQDARLFLARTALSKTGTYQWDTLARLMADEVNYIASGYSARFLYCSITDAPPRYLDLLSSHRDHAMKERLYWLYEELEKLPEADYLLSHEAKVLFQGWNHTLVNAEIEEEHFGLSLVYAKIESYTARIALWLHIVNAVLRGEKPPAVISGKTMQHAIEIASFYLWQHKLIHAHNSPTRQLEGIFLKAQTQAEKLFTKCGKGVNASFLKTRINALKSWAVEKIRNSIFKTLTAAGHGRIEGEGSEMVYVPNTVSEALGDELVGVDDGLVVSPIVETHSPASLQATVGEIGVKVQSSVSQQSVLEIASLCPDHQFTNSIAKTVEGKDLQSVANSTNPPPIPPIVETESQRAPTVPEPTAQELAELVFQQCCTWVELAAAVGQSTKKLMKAASQMTKEQRQKLTNLLTTHLCSSPAAISQLAWVPIRLRDAALKRLTFTIRQIRGVASSVLDARLEYVSGCKFVFASNLGTRHEQWIFQEPSGAKLSVFGADAVEAIALA